MQRAFRVVVAGFVASVFVAALSPGVARASFPGENGRFALLWSPPNLDVATEVILTASSTNGGKIDDVTVCDYGCHNNSPDWSPNGRRLAFVLERFEDDLPRLVTTRADGSDLRLVYGRQGHYPTSVAWSPDGRHIAFVIARYGTRWLSDIYVIRRGGGHLVRVTQTPHIWKDELDWSSGDRLVFRMHKLRASPKRYELFTMRPDGSRLRQLTTNELPDSSPDWAPGGKRLVFVRRTAQIWTVGLWGKNATMVGHGQSPAWAPDGTRIAYVGSDGAIHTMSPSGSGDVALGSPVTEGGISQLDWRAR